MLNIFINFKKFFNIFFKKSYKNILLNINFNSNFEYIFFLENKFLKKYKKNILFLKEGYLRCKANSENLKKRHNEEVLKIHKYSLEDFAENLLPVLDSLELTLNGKFLDIEKILDGIRLTLKIFLNVLSKKNISFILPNIYENFDPNKHLAISTLNCIDKKDNSIINVLQKGYYISDRILRPALVVVNKV